MNVDWKKERKVAIQFNENQLKIIALAAMTLDHLMWVLYPDYPTDWWIVGLHIIGRMAAPIFWFFVAEGAFYTHDIKRYACRLFVFAIISHFAYNFAFDIPLIPFQTSIFNQTSVIWALAWGLVALKIDASQNPKLKKWHKNLAFLFIYIITFCADWSSIAVVAMLQIGRNRGNFKKQMIGMLFAVAMYSVIYMLFVDVTYGAIQMFVILVIPFLKAYNGERGKWKGMKWVFYVYYPLHLVICGLIRIAINETLVP